MAERLLHLTLEILFRLTGEDYILVKTSSECCQAPVSEGWGRPLSPITDPSPQPPIHEDINDQKILELTYKMIELLTGEVPIRCQDVTVYFSMEEWEYLEEHQDLYKDAMMEDPQPLTSPVLSSKRTTPERCPRPLLPQDCNQEDPDVPQDHQGEDLPHINTTETYVSDEEWCNDEISSDNFMDNWSLEGHWMSLECDIPQDAYNEHAIIPNQAHHRKDLSSDPSEQIQSSDSSQNAKKNTYHTISVIPQSPSTEEKPFSCSECGKYFKSTLTLTSHQTQHTGEKPFFCEHCGKCFRKKSYLFTHQRIHTEEKLYSCSECGKNYHNKSSFVRHQWVHLGEKPYSCSKCGAIFTTKSSLVRHQNNHPKGKPYSCSVCGKSFNYNSDFVRHQITHKRQNYFHV
ncbi:gastrula zinc finger protein XlCGF66.1-like isoform 2-T2 [Anomaloglossus baeobatrachus]